MSLIRETVTEFGRSLGMDQLQLRPDGSTVLHIQSIGTLSIEVAGPSQDAVVISLARPLSGGAVRPPWATLLAATHYRARQPLPLRVGVAADHVVVAVLLAQENFTLPKIHEAITALDQQLQRWGGLV
jgi:type III secretion system chaperone SycN